MEWIGSHCMLLVPTLPAALSLAIKLANLMHFGVILYSRCICSHGTRVHLYDMRVGEVDQ